MDHEVSHAAVYTRTRHIRDSAHTDADLIARQLDTVDLIVGGATVRQIADHYGIGMDQVRDDYRDGLNLLRDRSIDATIALRDEITLRQRSIILANMPRAKAGDRYSAQIVQNADNLLISMWGLRSLRVERPHIDGDPLIADALAAYLAGLAARTG